MGWLGIVMPPELASLLNFGAIGAVLCYFLLKTEPRLRGIEEAIDRNSRAQMLFLLASEQVHEHFKVEAQRMLEEVQAAEARRRGTR